MIVDPKSGEIKDLGFKPEDYPELDEIYQLYDQDMAKAAYADKVCVPAASLMPGWRPLLTRIPCVIPRSGPLLMPSERRCLDTEMHTFPDADVRPWISPEAALLCRHTDIRYLLNLS